MVELLCWSRNWYKLQKNIFILKLLFQEQGKAFKGLEDVFKDEKLEDIYDERITDGDKQDIKGI